MNSIEPELIEPNGAEARGRLYSAARAMAPTRADDRREAFWRRLIDPLVARLRRALGADVEQAREGPYPWEASYPEGLSWRFDARPRPLYGLLDDAVTAYPERRCLSFLGKTYSYSEVGTLVAQAAKGFQDLGVTRGVKVGLFLPNSPYFVICFYAVLKAGGTVVNFNPLYAEREIAHQIRDSGVRIMVTLNLNGLYSKIAGRLEDCDLEKIVVCSMSAALPLPAKALFAVFRRKEIADIPADESHRRFEKLIANDGDYTPVAIDPDRDPAVLQYTGGTTGLPKGAMLTHGNLCANALQTLLWSREIKAGEEKILAVLPLFHVFGMTVLMNCGLCSGAEIVLLPHFRLSEVLRSIHRDKPTLFVGVPTIYSAINGHKNRDKYDLSSLKYCISGGAPLPQEIKRTFEGLADCVLVEGYGLTEAGPVCTINPLVGPEKPGSAGLPIPGTVVEILSLDDPTKTVPLGEKGEVCISGPQVMQGYWAQDEETGWVLRDGRLRTGDVGYLDEDGYLYLVDRIKDLIITGGYNVYPRMVEEALFLHPAVEEAAVCGVPDRHHGELVKAFVKLREGETLRAGELRRFLKDKVAPFELPRRIEFLDEIPKTLVGKPLKRELVAREARREREVEAKNPQTKAGEGPPTRGDAIVNA